MALPRQLVELAWLRVNAATLLENQRVPRAFTNNPRFLQANRLVRCMHALATVETAQPPPPMMYPQYQDTGGLDLENATFLSRDTDRVRTRPPKEEQVELRNRIEELLKLPVLTPEDADAEEDGEGPALTEKQLQSIYVDLLAPSAPENDPQVIEAPDPASRLELIEELGVRLTAILSETRQGVEPEDGLAATLLALRRRPRLETSPEPPPAIPSTSFAATVENEPTALALEDTPNPSTSTPLDLSNVDDIDPTAEVQPTDADNMVPTVQPFALASRLLEAPSVKDLDMRHPWNRVLAQLDVMLDRWQQDGVIVSVSPSEPGAIGPTMASEPSEVTIMPIGLSVVTLDDWSNIIHAAIDDGDALAADVTLQLMQRARVPISPELRYDALNISAKRGNVEAVESFIQRHCPVKSLLEKHLHVKSYARGARQSEACKLLHQYESEGCILPMKTYHAVIGALLYGVGPGESRRRAQAWDTFSNMRYVAHPVPDIKLYSMMIRACCLPRGESDAERAMDLWTELTVDQQMEPTVEAYNAIISVCARNSKYHMEAFRFARTMMDSSRDATGVPHLSPNYHTFVGLLQAGKRMGALARVRWLFAEILRMASSGLLKINTVIVQHVFHTYASYTPPRRKSTLEFANARGAKSHMETVPTSDSAISLDTEQDDGHSTTADSAFTGPLGLKQVLAETEALFQRIVMERNAGSGILSNIEVNSMLSNAYLSVYLKHTGIVPSMEAFERAFKNIGVPTHPETYSMLLVKARDATRDGRRNALQIAQTVFSEWEQTFGDLASRRTTVSSGGLDGVTAPESKPTYPINISEVTETVWGCMIEALAFANKIDDAMALLRKFEYTYPPKLIRDPVVSSELRFSKTALFGLKPIVRMTSETEVADDTVPPILVLQRIIGLYTRLLLKERVKDIKYVTYLTNAYQGNLLMRRDAMWGRERPQVQQQREAAFAAGRPHLQAPRQPGSRFGLKEPPPMLSTPVFKRGESLTQPRRIAGSG